MVGSFVCDALSAVVTSRAWRDRRPADVHFDDVLDFAERRTQATALGRALQRVRRCSTRTFRGCSLRNYPRRSPHRLRQRGDRAPVPWRLLRVSSSSSRLSRPRHRQDLAKEEPTSIFEAFVSQHIPDSLKLFSTVISGKMVIRCLRGADWSGFWADDVLACRQRGGLPELFGCRLPGSVSGTARFGLNGVTRTWLRLCLLTQPLQLLVHRGVVRSRSRGLRPHVEARLVASAPASRPGFAVLAASRWQQPWMDGLGYGSSRRRKGDQLGPAVRTTGGANDGQLRRSSSLALALLPPVTAMPLPKISYCRPATTAPLCWRWSIREGGSRRPATVRALHQAPGTDRSRTSAKSTKVATAERSRVIGSCRIVTKANQRRLAQPSPANASVQVSASAAAAAAAKAQSSPPPQLPAAAAGTPAAAACRRRLAA